MEEEIDRLQSGLDSAENEVTLMHFWQTVICYWKRYLADIRFAAGL